MTTFTPMYKNRRIRLLVIASVITLLTLLCIQVYLVTNTYKLYKNSFIQETKKKVDAVTKLPEMEELEDSIEENLKSEITRYVTKKSDKKMVLNALQVANTKASAIYSLRLSALLKKNFAIDSIYYSARYDEIIVEWAGQSDTLLKKENKSFNVIGKPGLPKDAMLLNRNIWHVNLGITDDSPDSVEKDLHISVQRSNYFLNIDGQRSIYKQMTGILALASMLITAIISLFYVIFHAMLKQKKLAAMKTDFANNITHELKTPLSSVGVILKSMKKIDQQKQVKTMQDLIDSMERQYAKIKRLIDNVLESTMSNVEIELKSVDMTAFLSKYAEDLWLDKHELKLDITLTQQCLSSNESALVRVLNILIDNAIKYSPPGAPITLKAFARQSMYYVQIIDHGPGISNKYHEAAFEKFFRVPGYDHYSVKGLGLGLFIAKETSVKINGSLQISNVHPTGCMFTLALPI